ALGRTGAVRRVGLGHETDHPLSQYCLQACRALCSASVLPSSGVPLIGKLPSDFGSGHSGTPFSRRHCAHLRSFTTSLWLTESLSADWGILFTMLWHAFMALSTASAG